MPDRPASECNAPGCHRTTTSRYCKVHEGLMRNKVRRDTRVRRRKYLGNWPMIRNRVLQRDRFRCVDCGATTQLEVDHIVPLQDGGTNDMKNLQTRCKPCHSRKTIAEQRKRGDL